VLDIADIALDYVKVSKVANLYLKLSTGETFDDSLKNAKASAAANVAKGLTNLHARILRIQKEQNLLYHTAPTSNGTPSIKLP
jgi:hypothetical protein